MMNLGDITLPDLHILVICKRLGAMAHVGGSHAVAVMVGVDAIHDVEGLSSSGVDFELDIGIKIGSILKSAGKLAKLLNAVIKAVGKAAQQEAGKKFAQGVMGDLSLDNRGRGFYMISTPAGAGLGGGVWYEWQEVVPLGGRKAWDKAPPKWKFESKNGKVRVMMENVPEQDDCKIGVQFRIGEWGQDPRIKWKSIYGGNFFVSEFMGIVHQHELYEHKGYGVRGEKGIPISEEQPIGTYKHGIGTMKNYNTVHKNTHLDIGVNVLKDSQVFWESKRYARVTTDANGRFTSIPTVANWLD
jgi:hypothetical protein